MMDWQILDIWNRAKDMLDNLNEPWEKKAVRRLISNVDPYMIQSHCSEQLLTDTYTNGRVQRALNQVVNIPDTYVDKDNFKKLTLITQLYKTGNKHRDTEITTSILKNIDNLSIDNIVIFTENLSREQVFETLQIPDTGTGLHVISLTERLTYQHIIDYVHDEANPGTIYVSCNSDCYFKDDIIRLKSVKYPKPTLYCMTRYDELPNGQIELGKNPRVDNWEESDYSGGIQMDDKTYNSLPFLEPWSTDAWVFNLQTVKFIKDKNISLNVQLGTNLCELKLQHELYKHGVELSNIGFAGFVKCIHLHNSMYREAANWQNKPSELIPGIYPEIRFKRTLDNSIHECTRLRTKHNWLDNQQTYWHEYSDYVVTNFMTVVDPKAFQTAIVYKCTKQDYEEWGQLQYSVEQFAKCTTDHMYDILFYFDQPIEDKAWFDNLKKQYKSIKHVSVNTIPDKCENVTNYILNMLNLNVYDSYVILEADCVPTVPDWYSKCIQMFEQLDPGVYHSEDAPDINTCDCMLYKRHATIRRNEILNDVAKTDSICLRLSEEEENTPITTFSEENPNALILKNKQYFLRNVDYTFKDTPKQSDVVVNDTSTIGIVTACMNRQDMLDVSLTSWLKCDYIKEVVIVDWSSEKSLKPLEKLDKRIKVVRVGKKKHFNLGKAFNKGIESSTCDKILKMDVDYMINPYYVLSEYIQLEPGTFVTGNSLDSNLDNSAGFIEYLNGFVYMWREDFIKSGGYDGYEDYGWDDDALYDGLKKLGLKRVTIDLTDHKFIYHNPHDDKARTSCYKNKNKDKSLERNKGEWRVEKVSDKKETAKVNKPKPILNIDKAWDNYENMKSPWET